MKINNVKNVDGLFKTIDSCSGKVELVGDGMRLNLKSKLAQYFSLAKVFSGGEEVPEVEIIAYEQEDIKKLLDFMVSGNHDISQYEKCSA